MQKRRGTQLSLHHVQSLVRSATGYAQQQPGYQKPEDKAGHPMQVRALEKRMSKFATASAPFGRPADMAECCRDVSVPHHL